MAETTITECPICVENFNKFNHKNIKCLYCDSTCCRSCMERYLENESSDPKCMNCQHDLSHDFLIENMTRSYMETKFKKHRESILLDREKSLLPHTQEQAQHELKIRNLNTEIDEDHNKIDELKKQIADITRGITAKRMQMISWRQNYTVTNPENVNNERAQFVRCCPADNCRGFLSTQWKCGICEVKVCNRCHVIKSENEEHVCNEDDVKSVELLNKDTKPCPSCGSMIHKIHGCDQMWCPQCRTAFSWRTGKLERGVVHNPHYYDWQRQHNAGVAPRLMNDLRDGCLDLQYYDHHNIRYHLTRNTQINRDTVNRVMSNLMQFHQFLMHVNNIELPTYRERGTIETQNVDLRIKYIINEIDEEKWKKLLQQREKQRRKKLDMYQILEMFYNTGSDIFKNITKSKTENDCDNVIINMDALITHVNTNLKKIAEKYKNGVLQLHYVRRRQRWDVMSQTQIIRIERETLEQERRARERQERDRLRRELEMQEPREIY